MRAKFASYSLELQEVLIGTPRAGNGQNSIEQILIQLRERQIAVEKVETYRLQEAAAIQERTLREKEALAEQQAKITTSALAIEISENEGKAQLARTRQQAETIQVTAKAEAEKVRLAGLGGPTGSRRSRLPMPSVSRRPVSPMPRRCVPSVWRKRKPRRRRSRPSVARPTSSTRRC